MVNDTIRNTHDRIHGMAMYSRLGLDQGLALRDVAGLGPFSVKGRAKVP